MQPYNYHFHSGPWCRGPSRLLFFFSGAAAATWYHHVKNARDHDRAAWGGYRQQLPPAEHSQGPSQPSPWARAWERRPTQEELSRQATDAMDATLDSVLRTVESLKAKLAEQRKSSEQHPETPRASDPNSSS
ncbi:hypothetical protein CPC08DRAFT_454487 [Agrocybe pediades]|nr:hypothetical protein CPC08DRAFT_454487 [Agrocybe pediades]